MTFDEFIAGEKPCGQGRPLYEESQMMSAYNAGFEQGHDRTMEKFGVKHFDVWYYPKNGELPKSEEMIRVLVYDGGTFYLGWYIPNNRKWLYAGHTTRIPEAWQYLPDFPEETK